MLVVETTSGKCHVRVREGKQCASVISPIVGSAQFWTVGPVACDLNLVFFSLRK